MKSGSSRKPWRALSSFVTGKYGRADTVAGAAAAKIERWKFRTRLKSFRNKIMEVEDRGATRGITGERVLYVNGTDLDEQFVDQLIGGASFAEVQYRRNKWLKS